MTDIKDNSRALVNETWLGRLQIVKPKKGARIGIPYALWHHLAIIDNYVLIYVWDSREIIDIYRFGDLTPGFDTVKIIDNGKQLFISRNSTERAKKIVTELLDKYEDLPITLNEATSLETLKAKATEALSKLDSKFSMQENAAIVFIDKDLQIPENTYMYKEMATFNPIKRKFGDNNAYTGRAKYFAIIARCAILQSWINETKA